MARDKGNQREMTARHEAIMREKREAYQPSILWFLKMTSLTRFVGLTGF